MRFLLLPCALALTTGCGSDSVQRFVPEDVLVTDSGLPRYDGSVADRAATDRPQPDVLDLTDVAPVDDMPASDVPCSPMFSGTIRFGNEGGNAAFTELFTLAPPLTFRAERRSAGSTTVTAMCETTVPGCDPAGMVGVGQVNAAFAARDVQVAFGMARAATPTEILYGYDPRPTDGSVYAIDIGGARVLVGQPCRVGMMSGCLNIPIGVQHLVDALTALHDQELLRAACMAFRRP